MIPTPIHNLTQQYNCALHVWGADADFGKLYAQGDATYVNDIIIMDNHNYYIVLYDHKDVFTLKLLNPLTAIELLEEQHQCII